MFTYLYVGEGTLYLRSQATGMNYKKTSVDWANFVRDLCGKLRLYH